MTDPTTKALIDSEIIKVLQRQLDEIVGECMDADGKPKAPSYRGLMSARGALPPGAKNAFPAKR